jgi:NAD(P)-dependent dehydrogenase (short-subunit alcohol dehydrogenase family)
VAKRTLDGQTAIITGGGRGIGLATAKHLAGEGCRTILWDLDFDGFEKTADGFKPSLMQAVDVTKLESIANSFRQAQSQFGRIEILVNNAGINGPIIPMTDYPLTEWDRVIAVDLTSVFLCCRAVVPHMQALGYGRIVNVSSIAGKEGSANASPYSAAKAGVIGFTKAVAKELATSGITINCIAPVITETPLLGQMTEEHVRNARSRIPMDRFCTIEEIAAMIAWIASPACSFTTGAVFDISGGRATY